MAFPENMDHLASLSAHVKQSGEGFLFLGNGSNLLVPEEGLKGWVIKGSQLLSSHPQVQELDGCRLLVNAALWNIKLLKYCGERGFSGLEFLAGVPGTIGGAAIMNAGTPEGCLADRAIAVHTFCLQDGEKHYNQDELRYAYRQQLFMSPTEMVTAVLFQMEKADPLDIRKKIKKNIEDRKKNQPLTLPSCGSVFQNPKNTSAWKCIEEAGLRGKKIGGARINEKHCNFIVNEGDATMDDVLSLIQVVREAVHLNTGIDLETEVVVAKPHHLRG